MHNLETMNYKYRMLALCYLKKQHVKISECEDGCRINFNLLFDFQYEQLQKIYLSYLSSIPLHYHFDWINTD